MPLSFAKMVTNLATVTMDFGDTGSLNIVYHPALITQDRMLIGSTFDDAKTTQATKDALAALNTAIVDVVASWDFYEDAEETILVPLTVERISQLPMVLRGEIYGAIVRDVRPNAKRPATAQTQS